MRGYPGYLLLRAPPSPLAHATNVEKRCWGYRRLCQCPLPPQWYEEGRE